MRLADRYDVICAGGGLSSYLCAALLARAGRKVLVIDDEDQAHARLIDNRMIFEPDFAVFSGINGHTAFTQSLSELGIEAAFERPREIIQSLTGDYRVAFEENVESLQRMLRSEFGQQDSGVADFFTLLAKAGKDVPAFVHGAMTAGQGRSSDTAAWRKYWGRYYSSIVSDRPIPLSAVLHGDSAEDIELLTAPILGASSFSAPVNLGVEQTLRGLSLAFQGHGYYPGGLTCLQQKLGDVITEAGGAVKRETRVESLIAESDRIVGVLLSSFEGIIRAGTVVLSTRLRRLYSTLPEGMQDSTLVRGLRRVTPHSWRFTLSVTVNKSVIPIGATSSMCYVGSHQRPLEEENYLRVQVVPDSLYPQLTGKGTVTLLATSLVPYRASAMDYSYLRRLGGRMLHVLAELMPFLADNIVGIYPDVRVSEEQLREAYPFSGPDWVPENLMQYYVRGQRSVQDFWGPAWTTPHRNLYFAGRSVWPSLGIYGEALTARKIFDDVMLPNN